MNNQKGFAFIDLVVIISIILVLSSTILLALAPSLRLAEINKKFKEERKVNYTECLNRTEDIEWCYTKFIDN